MTNRPSLLEKAQTGLDLKRLEMHNNRRLTEIARQVSAHAPIEPNRAPVVFFNATTRLRGISQNAAFAFLAASGLQLAGVPVVHFACQAGLTRCVLGTNRNDHTQEPPCQSCVAQSRWLYSNAPTVWFSSQPEERLAQALKSLPFAGLETFEYEGIPLGSLATPSLRWALRRHHLAEDEPTRFLYRIYLQSAYRVAQEFGALVEKVEPAAVVVFNGMMYPEAAARWAARQRGVRVISHEVGLLPFSGFFTEGDATAYPIHIPAGFELSPAQNARLDNYLDQRFQGKFTMAGIRFWPEMSGLSPVLAERISQFQQMVPVFTNVIFDTSQAHANTIFPHMFAWLEAVIEVAKQNPETLFVIRAHPDEMRPGKESRESVQDWVQEKRVQELPNVIFVQPGQYVSSYELVRRAKFVMVYNSSIGLEASLMGAAVLSGGKARYTQVPTVFFPASAQAYLEKAVELLHAGNVDAPPEFRENARRFLYFQLFRTSLPFSDYLDSHPWPGFVRLRSFPWQKLTPDRSETMRVIVDGVVKREPFVLDE